MICGILRKFPKTKREAQDEWEYPKSDLRKLCLTVKNAS